MDSTSEHDGLTLDQTVSQIQGNASAVRGVTLLH